MKKFHKTLTFLFLLMLLPLSIIFFKSEGEIPVKAKPGFKENPQARMEQEFMMLKDPVTNEIPKNIFRDEQEFAKTLPINDGVKFYKKGRMISSEVLTWAERGPNNIGGRTRALAADVRTTSAGSIRLIAGGVSGGLWYSTNEGSSWTKATTSDQIHSVTCVVQDNRSGQQDVWYAGTGESSGNSASGGGASFQGNGIFKSTDNGASWALLSSTASNTPQTYDNAFDYVHNIAVSTSNGYVYAAASNTIKRSTDGGTNWTTIIGSLANSSYTDVVVNSSGDVYVALTSAVTNPGIWKSTDNGGTWSDITPVSGSNASENFPATYTRVVLALAPSNNDILYVLARTPGAGQAGSGGIDQEANSFWKYDDSQSGTSRWVNRSSNLPTWTDPVGGLTTQGGYDMTVHVKPDNENFVLIGGTNLLRTTDGASTAMGLTVTHWIGGYAVANDFTQYANHHADHHSGAWRPGNASVFYSGHDGGISITTDITASTVAWSDLDASYNTSQFYAVSLAPEGSSNYILGGMQDNGNAQMDASGLASWNEIPGGGDGTYNAVAPLADDRFYSEQQYGRLLSFHRNHSYVQDFAPPSGTSNELNQLFVNPMALDPNDSNILYYAGGNVTDPVGGEYTGLWRNDDVNHATDPVSQWSQLTSTVISDGSKVTSIGVSTTPANVVYYGTSSNTVKRIDAANSGTTPTVTDNNRRVIPFWLY